MSNYKLKEFSTRLREYGPDAGKYFGSVKFINSESEEFTFNISQEQSDEFLKLIEQKIRETANELGTKLISSISNIQK